MTRNAAPRIFWAMRQEKLCRDRMVGLDADYLRILFYHSMPLIVVGVSWTIRN